MAGFSLMSKGTTTKTVVRPSKQVESMLKGIMQDASKIDDFDFIYHQAAEMNPQERAAINNLSQSGNLRAIGGALSPRLMQGIQQGTKLNETYENALSNNITPEQVLQNSDALRNGVFKGVAATAANAGGVANKFGAAGRVAARRGSQAQAASNALNPDFTNRAIEMARQNQGNTLDVARMQGNIAEANRGLGLTGVNAQNQATQNAISGGGLLQAYDNALLRDQQANQQGANNFIWQKINNKQSIMGQVSPMAGYTEIAKGAPQASRGQQLLGAAVVGLGSAAKAGMFNSNEQNAWDSYNKNGGQAGVAGPTFGGGNLSTGPQQTQTQSGWGNAWTGITGALSSFAGG